MADLWGALGAMATIIIPMALAGWLLGRKERSRRGHDVAPQRRRQHEDGE